MIVDRLTTAVYDDYILCTQLITIAAVFCMDRQCLNSDKDVMYRVMIALSLRHRL